MITNNYHHRMTWRTNCLAFSHRHLKKNDRYSLPDHCGPSRPLHQTQATHWVWDTWDRKTCCPAIWVSLAPGENFQLSLKFWLLWVLELDCLRRRETLGLWRVKAGVGIVVGTCIPLPYNILWVAGPLKLSRMCLYHYQEASSSGSKI